MKVQIPYQQPTQESFLRVLPEEIPHFSNELNMIRVWLKVCETHWCVQISAMLWAIISVHLQFHIHGLTPASNLNIFHVLHQFSLISPSQ